MRSTYLNRCKRLIEATIDGLGLDLAGITVLTEAATGPFALTASIALLAKAESVLVLAKDSHYGTREQAIGETVSVARAIAPHDEIKVLDNRTDRRIRAVDIVTNLAGVRPIDQSFIEKLGPRTVIPLMFESWEFRESDIDIEACRRKGLMVFGTNEKHQVVDVLNYIGPLAAKQIFESGLEVYNSKVILLASGIFAENIRNYLKSCGARVESVNVNSDGTYSAESVRHELPDADAIFVAEHQARSSLMGPDAALNGLDLATLNPGITVIHMAGGIDKDDLQSAGIYVTPGHIAPAGYMSVTTAHLGPSPLIRLHAAGLKVGEVMVRARRATSDYETAKLVAQKNPLCQDLDCLQSGS